MKWSHLKFGFSILSQIICSLIHKTKLPQSFIISYNSCILTQVTVSILVCYPYHASSSYVKTLNPKKMALGIELE